MDLQLNGKKALVLGGTRGIGRAIAETLADEGCDIGLCARNADQVAEAVGALTAKGVRATGAAVDIAEGEALKRWITETGTELGGIDILISNASALGIGNTEEVWNAGFQIDVMGAQRSAEAAMPFLEKAAAKHGDAAIVIIASIAAAQTDDISAYGAMKAALIHMTKGLGRANAPKHVRANVISPGTVYFEGGVWHMVEQTMPDFFKTTLERNVMGRMATPQDIANAAVFLASPVSSFTTGSNLVVDGAITRRVNY